MSVDGWGRAKCRAWLSPTLQASQYCFMSQRRTRASLNESDGPRQLAHPEASWGETGPGLGGASAVSRRIQRLWEFLQDSANWGPGLGLEANQILRMGWMEQKGVLCQNKMLWVLTLRCVSVTLRGSGQPRDEGPLPPSVAGGGFCPPGFTGTSVSSQGVAPSWQTRPSPRPHLAPLPPPQSPRAQLLGADQLAPSWCPQDPRPPATLSSVPSRVRRRHRANTAGRCWLQVRGEDRVGSIGL